MSNRSTSTTTFLQVPPPPAGTLYRFTDLPAGTRTNVMYNNRHAVCGAEFRNKESEYNLYCLNNASIRGASGFWTCAAHANRRSLDLDGHCHQRFPNGVWYEGASIPKVEKVRDARPWEPIPYDGDRRIERAKFLVERLVKWATEQPKCTKKENVDCRPRIEIHENGKTTIQFMSREQMANRNLPGREVFGPLNKWETTRFLKLAQDLLEMSAKVALIRGFNNKTTKIVSELATLTENIKKDKIEMGPQPLEQLLSDYTDRIGQLIRVKAQ